MGGATREKRTGLYQIGLHAVYCAVSTPSKWICPTWVVVPYSGSVSIHVRIPDGEMGCPIYRSSQAAREGIGQVSVQT